MNVEGSFHPEPLILRAVMRPKSATRSATPIWRISRRHLVRAIALLLLAIHLCLLATGARLHSPTFNEPGHLVAGLANWRGDFGVYQVNPPLSRMAAALPVLCAGAEIELSGYSRAPGARPEFELGEDFMAAHGKGASYLLTIARWACVPFSLAGGYICFRWATELYRDVAGLLALALWCFCPNILGHGQLITPDVASAALAVGAGYAQWRFLKRPTWGTAIAGGVTLGLACLCKTTLLVFYLLWPLLWVAYRLPERVQLSPREWLTGATMLGMQMLLGLYVINLGYAFDGTGTRLDQFHFVSEALGGHGPHSRFPTGSGNRFSDTALGRLPVPLPRSYLLGLDQQRRDLEQYGHPSYAAGTFSERGWWWYYLYGLALKVPTGSWLLLCLACTARAWGRVPVSWRDEMALLWPAIVLLVFVSSQTGFSEHLRYVLPVLPFFFVWVSRICCLTDYKRPRLAVLTVCALTWSLVSSLWIYPHSISYFNELAGGPLNGPQHLLHSNVDWGQDLLYLKRWLDQHPEAAELKLAYFGYFDPRCLEIECPALIRTDSTSIPPGWYAVSVNFSQGMPWFIYAADGTKARVKHDTFERFRQLKPHATAGYSIYIYHVIE